MGSYLKRQHSKLLPHPTPGDRSVGMEISDSDPTGINTGNGERYLVLKFVFY